MREQLDHKFIKAISEIETLRRWIKEEDFDQMAFNLKVNNSIKSLLESKRMLIEGLYFELSQEAIERIAELAFEVKPEHYLKVVQSRIPLHRDMPTKELHASIHIFFEKESGCHLCILKNGDICARSFPYYDGDLEGMLIVNNQVQILEIAFGI